MTPLRETIGWGSLFHSRRNRRPGGLMSLKVEKRSVQRGRLSSVGMRVGKIHRSLKWAVVWWESASF